jgi:hydroxymethylglutaryl-CoA synthase
MSETGWAVSYLFALSHGDAGHRGELAAYCYEAGVDPQQLHAEMRSEPAVAALANPEQLHFEAYPLTMAVYRVFRASRRYRHEILDKLALGSDSMLDLGNLYTAALPAWLAAGFEQALDEDSLEAGEEVLTLGYGSGDAAEIIPFYIAERWRDATAKIGFGASLEFAVDLDFDQYKALHDGRQPVGLQYEPKNEFVIEQVGRSDDRQFADLGIEYYRYVS